MSRRSARRGDAEHEDVEAGKLIFGHIFMGRIAFLHYRLHLEVAGPVASDIPLSSRLSIVVILDQDSEISSRIGYFAHNPRFGIGVFR
jgi:hypothetical protein